MNNSELRQRRHLKYALERRVEVYQRKDVEFPAKAGNIFTGVLEVPGKKYTIWVTLEGSNQVVEAINGRAIANVGTEIIVGYLANDQTKTMRVLRQAYIYPTETPGDGIPYHAAQHEWYGGDDVFISSGQILPGMVVPVVGTLTVQIYPRQYRTATGWYYPPAYVTVDMTSHVATTTGKARWSLIVVDSTGAFDVRDGSEITGFGSLTDADKPLPSAGDTPLWFVKSFAGITQFIHNPDNDYFEDARWTGGGGGGSGAIAMEELDGTPAGLITKLKVPNGSLSITSGVATFAPAGSGDFVGPAGATDGNLVVFDGATGKLGKDGGPVPSYTPPDYKTSTTVFIYEGIPTSGALTLGDPAINTAHLFNFYCNSQGTTADGDEVSFTVLLKAGTYKISEYGSKANTRAKLDWYLDGSTFTTGQDWYAASQTYALFTQTGITVTGDGAHTIKCKVNGRNASASGWLISLTCFTLTRTGA